MQYSQQYNLSWVLLKKVAMTPPDLIPKQVEMTKMSTGGAWNLDKDQLPPTRQAEENRYPTQNFMDCFTYTPE